MDNNEYLEKSKKLSKKNIRFLLIMAVIQTAFIIPLFIACILEMMTLVYIFLALDVVFCLIMGVVIRKYVFNNLKEINNNTDEYIRYIITNDDEISYCNQEIASLVNANDAKLKFDYRGCTVSNFSFKNRSYLIIGIRINKKYDFVNNPLKLKIKGAHKKCFDSLYENEVLTKNIQALFSEKISVFGYNKNIYVAYPMIVSMDRFINVILESKKYIDLILSEIERSGDNGELLF